MSREAKPATPLSTAILRLSPGIQTSPVLRARAYPLGVGPLAGWLPAPLHVALPEQAEPDLPPWSSNRYSVTPGTCPLLATLTSATQVRLSPSWREILLLVLLLLSPRLSRMCKMLSLHAQSGHRSRVLPARARLSDSRTAPSDPGQHFFSGREEDIGQRQEHLPPDTLLPGAPQTPGH